MANPLESKFGVRGALANIRRERFAQALAVRVPRLQAMHDAGYQRPSEPNARRLSNEPGVKARVAEIMLQEAEHIGAHAAAVILEMCRLGYANIHDLMILGDDGAARLGLDVNRPITRELAAAIQEISYDSNGNPKVKLHDKAAVLRDLAKIFELYSDGGDTSVQVNVGLGSRLDRAIKRVETAERA